MVRNVKKKKKCQYIKNLQDKFEIACLSPKMGIRHKIRMILGIAVGFIVEKTFDVHVLSWFYQDKYLKQYYNIIRILILIYNFSEFQIFEIKISWI